MISNCRASLLLCLSFLCVSCASRIDQGENRFAELTDTFLESHFAHRPLTGVALGWHQYDGQFVVPDRPTLEAEVARLRKFDAAFASIPEGKLSVARRHDLSLIRSTIANELWAREKQRVFSLNPMTYAGGLDVSVYLKRDFKPLPERVADITSILRFAPSFLAAAEANLEPVLPKPFVETAVQAARGTADFLEKDVAQAAVQVSDATVRAEFQAALKPAVAGLRAFGEWLEEEKLPGANQSFGLGRDHYIAMLEAELIQLTPERILEVGMAELREEQRRFREAAAVLDPSLKPLEAARLIQHDHPTAENLIRDARKNLEAIRQFVVDRRIVTIPSEVRARVEETLPPFRATSFASMDTPGPFETRATEAYYYITPVEPEWTEAQQKEWLGAFNYYTTDVVSIHEAYPGHYVQFLALNASPAGTVAKVFTSYPFIEGWAHYTEQMVLEEGFGQPTGASTATRQEIEVGAKYRLAQSIEALLRLCRLCCSIQLHTQGMTVDEATQFFMANCYYEEKPARSEAMRGTYDPGYLYYALGKLAFQKLRRDWQEQEGAKYSLQRFHDECLRHGAPPLPLLRRIMLRDAKKWPDLL